MKFGNQNLWLALCGVAAIASTTFWPANAAFPPEGFVYDKKDSSVAIWSHTTGSGSKVLSTTVRYRFNCKSQAWLLISVISSANSGVDWPKTKPSGPPIGAKRDPVDFNRAFNPATHHEFAYQNSNWTDLKTGKLAMAPSLCKEETVTSLNPIVPSTSNKSIAAPAIHEKPTSSGAGHNSGTVTPPPNSSRDHLPAAPHYVPSSVDNSHS